MQTFSRFLPLTSAVALLSCTAFGQPTVTPVAPPSAAKAETESPVSLDRVFVSAGLQDKTAFDLAQGTSILAADQLHRQIQATLGDTLAATPGVTSTSYGPGASRPVIRGLGGDRVRILENGVGSLDAANVSPDHNTAVEPLFADRIEVLRGPATLLYGSSAVGGVVNVVENRIPLSPLSQRFGGTLEVRGFGAAEERSAVGAFTGGTSDFRVQLDGLRQHTSDLRIPGVARIDADAPSGQPVGVLPNSDTSTTSGSLGASWFGDGFRLGAAASTYATTYGVPVDEPISIDMHQRRLDVSGETTNAFGLFQGLKARMGFGDYTHSEIADRTTINTTFRNSAWEGRLELPHAFAENFSGTIGVQASRSDFSAVGEEVVTPPSLTRSAALFALEEWKRGPLTLQGGARVEWQSIALGDFDLSALPTLPGYSASPQRTRIERGVSASLGAVYYPAKDWSVGFSAAYTERLPTAQELFSNGPHGGTGAYEIGTGGLGNERSLGLDLSVRRRSGFVTGSASVFLNKFQDYIFEQRLAATAIPVSNNPEALMPYQFIAKDAAFYGAESELSFHLLENAVQQLHADLMFDYVHAEQTTDREALPRTTPWRLGGGLRYERAGWKVGGGLRYTGRQNRVAPDETPTPGFTLLNADVSYAFTRGRAGYEIFLRGTNLTDRTARAHTSFLKDFAPLPGRSVIAGARLTF
jgi:iron complex outermembrane receptor protein